MLATIAKNFCRRGASHITRNTARISRNIKIEEKHNSFLSVFPELTQAITEAGESMDVPEIVPHVSELLKYNVLKEKRFRPSILLDTYKTLEEPQNLTEENLHLANVLAWCIELIQTAHFINDDIMDESKLRGNQACWYQKENVGLNAINDSILVYESSYILLEKYFSNRNIWILLQNVFRYIYSRGAIGQYLDWTCNVNRKPNFGIFTKETYNKIIRNKGCIPFVDGPFKASLILSNNYNKKAMDQVNQIVLKIGDYFQIDNDVLDIFDDGRIRDPVGSDIREGKCSWLAVQVMESGNKELIDIFSNNYGQNGIEHEKRIINVYMQMELFNKHLKCKKQTLNYLKQKIGQMTESSLKQAVTNLMDNVCI
ncbi:hypothetical protein FQA39_LY09086 [Lamprigera yunnana]|nr:hypothetical protein FQA39_LY09086 [Lamprigera yunnana]